MSVKAAVGAATAGTDANTELLAIVPGVSSNAETVKNTLQAPEVIVPDASGESVHLTSLFEEKDDIKALGARWDADEKCWYVPAGKALKPFAKWISAESAAGAAITAATAKKNRVPKPAGKPKKLPAKTLKLLVKEENRLQSLTAAHLKDALKLNDQKMAGTKSEQIAKVAEGIVLGAIPRCPSCAGGRPHFDRQTSLYSCPGYMDDSTFVHCNWSSYTLKRRVWQQ